MRILLVDDHAMVRDALSIYLASALQATVATAGTIDEAISLLSGRQAFDVTLLDYRMPGMNRFAGMERIIAMPGCGAVAVLTAMPSDWLEAEALERGARAFLEKSLSGEGFVERIREIVAGKTPKRARPATDRISLTAREQGVLEALGRSRSNKEIAREIGLTEVTIKMHVTNLMKKLDARNRSEIVVVAMTLGIL